MAAGAVVGARVTGGGCGGAVALLARGGREGREAAAAAVAGVAGPWGVAWGSSPGAAQFGTACLGTL